MAGKNKICKVCKMAFVASRGDKRSCSKRCAKIAWYRAKGSKYFKERYRADPEKFCTYAKRHRAKLKDICFLAYGGYACNCSACDVVEEQFLTLDHINNDGAAHRREIGQVSGDALYRWIIKNNFPPIFQVLCYNCNCAKNFNGGICPHLGGVSYGG